MVERYDPFDIGVKYGKVGQGLSNFAGDVGNKVMGDQNKEKIAGLVSAYNNSQAPFGANESPAGKALRLSQLLYPLDPEMSSRYEKIATDLRGKEASQKREDTQNLNIANAFTRPETEQANKYAEYESKNKQYTAEKAEYPAKQEAYTASKSRFLADTVVWPSIAKDIVGLNQELARAESDLDKLLAMRNTISEPGSNMKEPPPSLVPRATDKYKMPNFNTIAQDALGLK